MPIVGIIYLFLTLSACTVVSFKNFTLADGTLRNSGLNPLLLNGYYYQKEDSTNGIKAIFLYSDGTVLSLNSFAFDNEESLASFAAKVSNDERKIGENWGYYYIEGDTILIQTVEMLSSGGIPAVVGTLEHEGRVICDSMFVINRAIVPRWSKTFNETTTYVFRKFSPKPSSANWVKEKLKQED